MLMVYSNENQDNLSFEFYDYDLRKSISLNQTINFERDMMVGDGFNPLDFGMIGKLMPKDKIAFAGVFISLASRDARRMDQRGVREAQV